MIPKNIEIKLKEKLDFLYDEPNEELYDEIKNRVSKFINDNPKLKDIDEWVDENDIFLITYGNSVTSKNNLPFKSLNDFSNKYLKNHIKNIHLLPFFPYSSDDGFSVIDYYKVNDEIGSWSDVESLNKHFELMFDGVINHISSESKWFKKYLLGDKKYSDYFIEADECDELKKVTRPRVEPLLSEFDTKYGKKKVWTTFSSDQIDLNYKSKSLLLEVIDVVLFYVSKGSRFLRLDAIGYLWKEIGTTCIHLEETHIVIQLFRDILDVAAPSTVLITETNVPHKENISYFGNGLDEAQMVYQFPLPPLVLHAIHYGNGKYLSDWAKKLELNSNKTTFFNFLASHDGIGLMPAKDILPKKEIDYVIERVKENGGLVSYKDNPDGSKSAYEINVNYFDALISTDDNANDKINKFILAQSILLSVIGVPAIYIHSLVGSRNYYKGVEQTGRNRTINREALDIDELIDAIEDNESVRSKVYHKYINLIDIRKKEKCFHPNAKMEIVDIDSRLFAYKRKNGNEEILVVNNLSNEEVIINNEERLLEIVLNEIEKNDVIILKPYQMKWLKKIGL